MSDKYLFVLLVYLNYLNLNVAYLSFIDSVVVLVHYLVTNCTVSR